MISIETKDLTIGDKKETKELIEKYKIKFNPDNLIFKYEVCRGIMKPCKYLGSSFSLNAAKKRIEKDIKNQRFYLYVDAYKNNDGEIFLETKEEKC